MMPELGMDMFDTHMPPAPEIPDLEGFQRVQPEADVMVEPLQETDAHVMPADQPAAEDLMPDQGMLHLHVHCYVLKCSWEQ